MQSACLDWFFAVPALPKPEHFDDGLPLSVLPLGVDHPHDGIGAAERQQRIAHPLTPLRKTAERLAGYQRGLLSPPTPNREDGDKEVDSPLLYELGDVVRKPGQIVIET